MPNDLNLPNWVVSGLEKRCEVIIKEQRENNFRQIAEACLVVDIEHLDYNQGRNISCNDRVIIHKLKAQSSKVLEMKIHVVNAQTKCKFFFERRIRS